MKQLHLLLFCIIIVSCPVPAEQSRFLRVLDRYTGHLFTHEKRNVLFNYITNNNPEIDKINAIDTAVFRDRLHQFNLSFKSGKHTGSLLNERRFSYQVGFNSIYDFLEHQPVSNECYLDTLSYLLELRGNAVFDFTRYLMHNREIKKSFVELHTAVHGRAYYSNTKGYDPDFVSEELSQFLKEDWIIEQQLNTTFFIDVSAGVGIGKPPNLLPVYQVFKLEKELLKRGVAGFPLSDRTIIAIAELLAKNNTYKFKKLEKTKEFKKKLDAVIVDDEAVEKKSLRYISPLDIKKILLCNVPLFRSKPRLQLVTTSRMIPALTRNETTFPYDSLKLHNDTVYTDATFRYKHSLGMAVSWGIPLTAIWFLDMKAERNLLSTDRGIDLYTAADSINWDEVLDIRFSLQTSLWLTNWLLFQTGFTSLPTWVGIPNRGPYYTYLNGNIFIEDYLTITATGAYYNNQPYHVSYATRSDPLDCIREGLHLLVMVHYNF